jgi:hypothetical protein
VVGEEEEEERSIVSAGSARSMGLCMNQMPATYQTVSHQQHQTSALLRLPVNQKPAVEQEGRSLYSTEAKWGVAFRGSNSSDGVHALHSDLFQRDQCRMQLISTSRSRQKTED